MEKVEKDQKIKKVDDDLKLLDMTRIPEDWYPLTEKLFVQATRTSNMIDLVIILLI